jgi:Activator of Hsp90 ATPase homolog 1-like protein
MRGWPYYKAARLCRRWSSKGCAPKIRFAVDSPVEGARFEPSVPLGRSEAVCSPKRSKKALLKSVSCLRRASGFEARFRPSEPVSASRKRPRRVVSTFEATYYDVIPNERLVYSYAMHLDEKKISLSLATLQLKVEARKTTLMVTEQGAFLDGYDDAGSREQGTGHLLDALGTSLMD